MDSHLEDSLYKEVEEFVKPLDFIRPGQIQVKFLLGYNRADSLIQKLIAKGIIYPEAKFRNYEIIKDASNSRTN